MEGGEEAAAAVAGYTDCFMDKKKELKFFFFFTFRYLPYTAAGGVANCFLFVVRSVHHNENLKKIGPDFFFVSLWCVFLVGICIFLVCFWYFVFTCTFIIIV